MVEQPAHLLISKVFGQLLGYPQQHSGQLTLFFKTGSVDIDQFQNQRLVSFLDYLSRESRRRTVIP